MPTTTKTNTTIIISFKNTLLFKQNNKLISLPISQANNKNLPTGKLDFRINKQWLSPKNRYKIELLSNSHLITNNTIYPAADSKTQYDNVLNFVSTKQQTLELTSSDLKILSTLIKTYNISSIKKQLIKLSIKL